MDEADTRRVDRFDEEALARTTRCPGRRRQQEAATEYPRPQFNSPPDPAKTAADQTSEALRHREDALACRATIAAQKPCPRKSGRGLSARPLLRAWPDRVHSSARWRRQCLRDRCGKADLEV